MYLCITNIIILLRIRRILEAMCFTNLFTFSLDFFPCVKSYTEVSDKAFVDFRKISDFWLYYCRVNFIIGQYLIFYRFTEELCSKNPWL